ncbi:MAG: acyl--CoA ligase [Spirochaetaceae bacterium]|jgi:long-chain acyl-CoA synthetase|nr:acyl--CoA ligase [Spirochaetaceae bacterium]
MYEKQPWLKAFGDTPHSLTYPDLSMYGMLKQSCDSYPNSTGLIFFDRKTQRSRLDKKIVQMSRAFAKVGVAKGDIVIVCLPNCPQAVISFYALTRLGAIPAPIHPLSAPPEIETFAKLVSAKVAITLDGFYPRFAPIQESAGFEKVIVCSLKTEMPLITKIGFSLTLGRKIPPVPWSDKVLSWAELESAPNLPEVPSPDPIGPDEMALILFSGGSTGEPKAIMLSNRNCNALALQMNAAGGPILLNESMLSILPLFHGFGFAVGIHAILINHGTCILIPKFKATELSGLVKKYRPQFMAGVPTLFDALASDAQFNKLSLSSFKGIFCGGDSLSPEIKKRFDAVLEKGGATVTLREGYGLTESVTACAITPRKEYRERTFGVPCPDNWIKVVKPGTDEECPVGEDGEICVSGPTVMLGYYKDPAATAGVLKKHSDGRVWLHSGDVGSMDADGFFYFKQRSKRIIKSSGIGVFPSQIEDVLNKHPAVRISCVIGMPHDSQGEVPKAFIVLNPGYEGTEELKQEIIASCKSQLFAYARPKTIEFLTEMPMTNVGKVSFKALEELERNRRKEQGASSK